MAVRSAAIYHAHCLSFTRKIVPHILVYQRLKSEQWTNSFMFQVKKTEKAHFFEEVKNILMHLRRQYVDLLGTGS